jgi:hypothetical protein
VLLWFLEFHLYAQALLLAQPGVQELFALVLVGLP